MISFSYKSLLCWRFYNYYCCYYKNHSLTIVRWSPWWRLLHPTLLKKRLRLHRSNSFVFEVSLILIVEFQWYHSRESGDKTQHNEKYQWWPGRLCVRLCLCRTLGATGAVKWEVETLVAIFHHMGSHEKCWSLVIWQPYWRAKYIGRVSLKCLVGCMVRWSWWTNVATCLTSSELCSSVLKPNLPVNRKKRCDVTQYRKGFPTHDRYLEAMKGYFWKLPEASRRHHEIHGEYCWWYRLPIHVDTLTQIYIYHNSTLQKSHFSQLN